MTDELNIPTDNLMKLAETPKKLLIYADELSLQAGKVKIQFWGAFNFFDQFDEIVFEDSKGKATFKKTETLSSSS